MRKNNGYTNAQLYKKVLEHFPIACVDVVVVRGGKFLLVRRANAPAKGKWWFPGGRILKGETLEKSVVRKVKEETNLAVSGIRLLTATNSFFKDSVFGPPTHSVVIVFIVRASGKKIPKPDNQSVELRWFSHIEKNFPQHVKKMLALAGF